MKRLFVFLLTTIIILSVSGCGESTARTEKTNYSMGDLVKIYDKESSAFLGEFTINDVRIIRDSPYTSRDYLCKQENLDEDTQAKYEDRLVFDNDSVYLLTEYQVVVQIDYNSKTSDSSKTISESNFIITDHNGNKTDRKVDTYYKKLSTTDNSIIVGLMEKGDINIGFFFNSPIIHTSDSALCNIICPYDSETNSYLSIETDESASHFCPSCNTVIDNGDKYCSQCGQKLDQMI